MTDWQDRIVGARMAVDTEFADRVEASGFSRQEWGLVMTATEFDIEDGDEPRLYADTSRLPDIMPEVEKVEERTPMGPGGQEESSGGILSNITSALGLGGDGGSSGDTEERVREAEELTQGYARELQRHLEEKGSWEDVVAAYRDGTDE
ncbi:DUF5799 family protein [Halosegnis marinus]|uniref:DUF5799 family protein n=1 Tax=Halosegnis marinus TaxID=3034023 RepID=A0ABD5ZL56_9EURY|nr:DUF5799 family protein [Halosegnis sp. DT85]